MANPIRLPFYEYQVNPQGGYGGPSFGDVIGATNRRTQRANVLRGAVVDTGLRFLENQRKVQEAYDLGQLAKAKARYFAKVKKAVEELEFSPADPLAYNERIHEVSEEAYAEGRDLLGQSKGRTLLGASGVRTELTASDFETWRIEQDAAFGSVVLQSQRKKMTAGAMEAIAAEFTLLRKDPDYLPVFLDNLALRRQTETISAEYAIRATEAAQNLALIAGYDRKAKSIASSQGIPAAEVWVATRENFVLDGPAHAQFQQDFNSWAGATRSQAERTKIVQVQKAQEDYLQRFVSGDRAFTKQYILGDPMTARDPNAQQASEQADEVRRRFIGMLEARNNAANAGVKDPNNLTNKPLEKQAMDMIYDPLVNKVTVEQFLDLTRGANAKGSPQISLDDSKMLWALNEQQKKSPAYGAALQSIGAASGINKALTDQEGADAITALNNWVLSGELATRGGVGKPRSEKEITQFVQNWINEGLYAKMKAGIKVINATPSDERLQDIWEESRQKDWFYDSRGRGGKARNIEAFILRGQSGLLSGLRDRPDYVPIFQEAQRTTNDMFRKWSDLEQGDYTQQVWSNGLIVYRVEQTLPRGGGRQVKFFTLTYDKDRDKMFWTLIQPSDQSRVVLESRTTREQVGFQAVIQSSLKDLEQAMYQSGSPYWTPPEPGK